MFFQYISSPLPSYITVNELKKEGILVSPQRINKSYQVQQQQTNKEARKRMKWTPELKNIFLEAVEELGIDGMNLYPNLMLL